MKPEEQEVVEPEELQTEEPKANQQANAAVDDTQATAGSDDDEIDPAEAEFWKDVDKAELGTVPTQTFVRHKLKWKGRIKEQGQELEALRKENEALRAASRKPLQRPSEDDFQTREEYSAALTQYELDLARKLSEENRAEELTRASREQLEKAVAAHYERVDAFIKKAGIDPTKYVAADEAFRRAIDEVWPGKGDEGTEHLIALAGEGSEKLKYLIGSNPGMLSKFRELLAEDRSGLKAAMFLGRQQQKLSTITPRNSKAPAPGHQLKGDVQNSSGADAMRKRYQEAMKKNNVAIAFDLRKQARAAGYNISGWDA